MKNLTNREKLTVLKFDLIKLIIRGRLTEERSREIMKNLTTVNQLLEEYSKTGNINIDTMNSVEDFVSIKTK